MEIELKCLPLGSLPYEEIQFATKMMAKLFEQSPYLAAFPKVLKDDNVLHRSLVNLPGIKIKDNKIIFRDGSEKTKQELVKIDTVFNSPTHESLEQYGFETPFLEKFFHFLQRFKPKEAVVNILGPVSLSQMLVNKEETQLLTDKYYRKVVIQAICIKALWIIAKVKEFSPDTMPIIVLEEPLLCKIGDIKRENEDVTRETIVNMYTKVFQKIKEYQGVVAVQSFSKCDWSIPIEAGVDIISFDAYNNPNNLNIIAEKVNNFLINGGRINWAIVPVNHEAMVKSLKIDEVLTRFVKTIEGLIASGVNERVAYSRAMVSITGDIDHLPVIFAEKALMIATQLAKRIATKERRLPPEHSNQ